MNHKPERARGIFRVTASFRSGPPPGWLPDLHWSVWSDTGVVGLRSPIAGGDGPTESLRQEASWGTGGGVWEVPFDFHSTGRSFGPRLIGWEGTWASGGLWVQRWTLRPVRGVQGMDAAPDTAVQGDASGSPSILEHHLRVAGCQGEVIAGRVLAEVRLQGEAYLPGRGGAVRCLPLTAETSAILQVSEARQGDVWRAAAEVREVVWRPARGGSLSMAAVVHLRWRLLREEVVRWPPEGNAPAVLVPGQYLVNRIVAEGEESLPVQAGVALPPDHVGLIAGTAAEISLSREVQRIRLEPLEVGPSMRGSSFKLALLLNTEGLPILGVRSADSGWRWARPPRPAGSHRRLKEGEQGSLLSLEWADQTPDARGEAVCTVTLVRGLRVG